MAFYIPKEALSAIQNNVPAERFHKAVSLFNIASSKHQGPSDIFKSAVTTKSVEDKQTAQIDSWWGAVAALMLLQSYSFILLQGLIFIFTRAVTAFPVLIPWLLLIALCQAAGLRVMHKYLKNHGWQTAFLSLRRPFETLKFGVAILATGIYLYLLTGHKPVPADPALYHDVGILDSLLFQLFYLALSFLLTWIWKMAPKIEAARLAAGGSAKMPPAGWKNVISGVVAMAIGIGLIAFCYFHREAFYLAGVLGYGIITIVLSPALTTDPRSWVVKK